MMLYISMKFHENIFNGFQDIERTRLCDRSTDEQNRQIRVTVLAVCTLYISMKFHDTFNTPGNLVRNSRYVCTQNLYANFRP